MYKVISLRLFLSTLNRTDSLLKVKAKICWKYRLATRTKPENWRVVIETDRERSSSLQPSEHPITKTITLLRYSSPKNFKRNYKVGSKKTRLTTPIQTLERGFHMKRTCSGKSKEHGCFKTLLSWSARLKSINRATKTITTKRAPLTHIKVGIKGWSRTSKRFPPTPKAKAPSFSR